MPAKLPLVLAFDTSVTGCAVCVTDGEKFWTDRMETERGQAEFLVPMIDALIKKSAHGYSDLSRIAVTIGPGSFTGVRVGLSTAKALGLSLDIPVFGFSTLEVMAREVVNTALILIDTKRGDFYGQIFEAEGNPRDQPKIWSDAEIEKSGLNVLKDIQPDVEILAGMGFEIPSDEIGYNPLKAPEPLYLRGAEVSQSKRVIPTIVKS